MNLVEGLDMHQTLQDLQKGHKEVSTEIVHLLSFNVNKSKDRIRRIYEQLFDLIGERKQGIIKEFLDEEFDFANMEDYIKFNKNLIGIEWRILNTFDQINNDFEISFNDMNGFRKEYSNIDESNLRIYLGKNMIGNLSLSDFEEILETLPSGLKTLDLEYNELISFSEEGWYDIVRAMPKNIISLGLSMNQLGEHEDEEFQEIMSYLPRNILHLDLSRNNLSEIALDYLKKSIASLPQDLMSLDLENNDLFKFDTNIVSNEYLMKYIEIISALPRNLKRLDISNNHLGTLPTSILKGALESIPRGLRVLKIKGGGLGDYNKESLKKLLSALPPGLMELDISLHRLRYTKEELGLGHIGFVKGLDS